MRVRAGSLGVLALAAALLRPPAAGAAPALPDAAAGADSTATGLRDAGTLAEVEFMALPSGGAALRLAHEFIDPASLRLYCGGRLLSPATDYRLRARSGVIVPLRDWAQLRPGGAAEDAGRGLLIAFYAFDPVPVAARRDLRPVGAGPSAPAIRDAGAFLAGAPSPAAGLPGLAVSGSKTVQVSSGSRRDLAIDQNLRLTIDGRLTPDIYVRALLADDNLPVVPEGNTEELKDIDKVLIQMTAPHWEATLGDFVAARGGTAFGDYQRKLQGLAVAGGPPGVRAEVLAGSPRGRYRTLQINGQEANQGPYFLAAGSAQENLFLVAGSERVTLDGEPLVRGADRDYVIDYVRGAITFTYRRLITAQSAIVVQFEEGEGPYARTVVGAGARADGRLPGLRAPGTLAFRLTAERDDPARLRTGDLQPADESVLAAAGDDPDLAVASGVTPAADGTGLYDLAQTQPQPVYVYDPTGGDYNLTFYYGGPGAGDYDFDRIDPAGNRIYAYRGPGAGAYRIGRPLDLPQRHDLATMMAALGDSAGAHLAAEWNASDLDRNALSGRDDGNNAATALRVQGALPRRDIRAGGRDLGEVSLAASYEDREADFAPFQLRRTVFDYERWGLLERARAEGFLEQGDRESSLQGRWRADGGRGGLALGAERGTLRHGVGLSADRNLYSAEWTLRGGYGRHRWQEASAADAADPLAIRSTDRRHELGWTAAGLRPRTHYRFARWQDAAAAGGGAGGFRYEEYGAALQGARGGLDLAVEFTRGLADSLRTGGWTRERDSRTTAVRAASGRVAGVRLVSEGTLRRVLQGAAGEQTTRLARVDLAGRWERSGSDWSLGYRVDNSRSEVLDRQIVFVGERQGDFNQDGLYVGEGLGEFDVVLAGTDSLVATTGVRADLNWRQDFSFLGAGRWFGAWSLWTLAAAEGRSTTQEVGRLLALDPGVLWDDGQAVLADVSFSEEAVLLKHLRRVDLRGKFDYRQTRDRQYADHPQDRLSCGWLAYGTWNATAAGSLNWRWQRLEERLETPALSGGAQRGYDALTHRYELGWTHTAGPNLRLSLQGEVLRRRDEVSGVKQTEIAARPAVRRRLPRGWTVQAELRAFDVSAEEPAGAVRPWFFPQPGFNAESSLRVAWEPSRLLTLSAGWFGRKQGQRGWQHDVRLESTARF